MSEIERVIEAAENESLTVDWEEFITMTQSILDAFPENSAAHFNHGYGLYQLGQNEEAAKCFVKALHIEPSNSNALYLLCEILKELDRLEEATSLALQNKRFVQDTPFDNRVYGLTLFKLHQETHALPYLRKAFAQGERDTDVLYALGSSLYDVKEYAEAEGVFRMLVDRDPSKSTSWSVLTICLYASKKLDEALVSAEKAVECEPTDIHTYLLLIKIARENDDLQKAKAFALRALEVRSDKEIKDDLLDVLLELGE